MLELILWASFLFIIYAYFGYPVLLMAFSIVSNKKVTKGDISSNISFIITAYNEEKRIKEKIENTLKQNYPKDKLEILIASDGSTDRTDEIVESFHSSGVRLVKVTERKGKENAQRYAIDVASGYILVFSDVATILEPDGISNIVKNFNDPTVGCVSSVDRFLDSDGKISGEGAYVRYEMFLRNLETKVNTLVGLSGSFFAARREVCNYWAIDLQSDFNTLINSYKMGLRGVLDNSSIGYYKDIIDKKKEFERKVRTVLRGISVFMKSLPLLNPFRYGIFSWQLISHKLCRWLVPFALILLLFSNIFLVVYSEQINLYALLLAAQFLFYLSAVIGILNKNLAVKSFIKLPLFFVMVNFSILIAWLRYLKGDTILMWEPSKR